MIPSKIRALVAAAITATVLLIQSVGYAGQSNMIIPGQGGGGVPPQPTQPVPDHRVPMSKEHSSKMIGVSTHTQCLTKLANDLNCCDQTYLQNKKWRDFASRLKCNCRARSAFITCLHEDHTHKKT